MQFLLCHAAASAQESYVRGRVVDAGTGTPLAAVDVRLLGPDSVAVAGAATDSVGRFLIEADEYGRYRLHAERIGYAAATTPPLDLLPEGTVDVELRLSRDPIELAPLEVLSDRPALVMDARLKRWGFYERRSTYGDEGMGFAEFLTAEEVHATPLFRATDVLRQRSGIRLKYVGGRDIRVVGRRGCRPAFYLDGVEIKPLRDESIDDYIAPFDLVAVEIYSGMVTSGDFPGICGAVVFWTGIVPER